MICGNGRSAYSDARRLTVEAAGERSSTETLLWDVAGSEPNGGLQGGCPLSPPSAVAVATDGVSGAGGHSPTTAACRGDR